MSSIEPTSDFQQRMFERIRDQMGDLLSDEDLKRIVETAVQKAFFEPVRSVDHRGYASTAEPLFLKHVQERLKPQVEAAIVGYMKQNEPVVRAAIESAMKQSMAALVGGMFSAIAQQSGYQFVQELRNQGLLR